MRITWYGHAAFHLEDASGRTIICDPYNPELVGFAPIKDSADLVIASSATDEAHSRHDLIPGSHRWLNALDVVEAGGAMDVDGLDIRACEAMEILSHTEHDPEQNAMYRFELDGVRIAHMGDIGNPLNERQMTFLQDVDVLLALAGEGLVISLPELQRVIKRTKPRLVIPMHFRTLCYKPKNLNWIPAFLALFEDENIDFAFGPTTDITRETLPASTRALVLDYLR